MTNDPHNIEEKNEMRGSHWSEGAKARHNIEKNEATRQSIRDLFRPIASLMTPQQKLPSRVPRVLYMSMASMSSLLPLCESAAMKPNCWVEVSTVAMQFTMLEPLRCRDIDRSIRGMSGTGETATGARGMTLML